MATDVEGIEPTFALVVVSRFPPAHGGAGLRLKRTYKRLSGEGSKISVLTYGGRGTETGRTTDDIFDVLRVNENFRPILLVFLIMISLIRLRAWRFKSVHVVGSTVLALISIFFLKAMGLRVVRELTSDKSMFESNAMVNRLVKVTVRISDFFMVSKKSTALQLTDIDVPEEKIWVRINPVDVKDYGLPTARQREVARSGLGVSEGSILHLMIGRFRPLKNQILALEALAKMPQNHIVLLAGPVLEEDAAYYQEVQDKILEYGLEGRVTLIPEFVIDALSLYWAADMYLMLSTSEGLGNVALEALSTGLPVVANHELGLETVVVNGETGLNIPLDLESLVKAMKSYESGNYLKKRGDISALSQRKFDANEFDVKTSAVLGLSGRQSTVD